MKNIKSPKHSETIMTEIVCPNDTNPMGILQGGKLVQWMNIASAICAQNHAEHICVTAFIDSVKFKSPAKVGDIITIKAKMMHSFHSSMEIFEQAWQKNLSQKAYLINEAYFTFVALDDNVSSTIVPAINVTFEAEKKEFANALTRKNNRIKK